MKVKICGIRTSSAALAAEAGGADYVGFVFYKKSRRYITAEDAEKIASSISAPLKVGVFVDEQPEEILRTFRVAGLDLVQLHGHEDADFAKGLGLPLIKAFRWGDDFSVSEANSYGAKYILIDSFSPGSAGGTGKSFSWQEAREAAESLSVPFFVAGGISEENVREAANVFHPFGVDVSGSLEINGEKSPEKILRFLDLAKNID